VRRREQRRWPESREAWPARSLAALGWVSCASVKSLLTADDLFLFDQGTHYRLCGDDR
jgi:hypothetical protein